MKRFWRPTAAALAIAQRQMAASERWRDPYFWAGFVVQGDWRAPQIVERR